MTRCSELEPEILFRADGEGDPSLDAAVSGHLRECGECRAYEAEARARIASLRALPRVSAPPALDARARREIEELVAAPETARERWVARWLEKLPRLAAPAELGRRVLEPPAVRRGRLIRFAAAAASAAAVVLAGWFALDFIRAGSEPTFRVVESKPSDLRIQASLSLARSLGGVEPGAEERR